MTTIAIKSAEDILINSDIQGQKKDDKWAGGQGGADKAKIRLTLWIAPNDRIQFLVEDTF